MRPRLRHIVRSSYRFMCSPFIASYGHSIRFNNMLCTSCISSYRSRLGRVAPMYGHSNSKMVFVAHSNQSELSFPFVNCSGKMVAMGNKDLINEAHCLLFKVGVRKKKEEGCAFVPETPTLLGMSYVWYCSSDPITEWGGIGKNKADPVSKPGPCVTNLMAIWG